MMPLQGVPDDHAVGGSAVYVPAPLPCIHCYTVLCLAVSMFMVLGGLVCRVVFPVGSDVKNGPTEGPMFIMQPHQYISVQQ